MNPSCDLPGMALRDAILRFPEAEPTLLAPICNNWEKAPGLMENLLWGLLIVGLTPECEGRLVDVWHRVGIPFSLQGLASYRADL